MVSHSSASTIKVEGIPEFPNVSGKQSYSPSMELVLPTADIIIIIIVIIQILYCLVTFLPVRDD